MTLCQERYTQDALGRMGALQHYLYEEDLKAGDTGAAAVIAAEREEVAYQQNLKVIGNLLVSSFINSSKISG